MTKKLLIRFAAVLIATVCTQLHAQIISNTTPYTFSTSQSAINIINGTSLFTGDYDHTNGGANNDWVLTPDIMGSRGPQLGSATSAALFLTGGPVPFGTSIDSSGTYSRNFLTSASSFTDEYWGLSFTLSPGNVEYGWAELSFDSTTGNDTIVAAAVDTTVNDGIQAGAVPEPSTLGIFVVGVGSLLIARRRRRA